MADKLQPEFLRARTDEQREVRRTIILGAARELLDAAHVREISLRELSRKVDLSKANVIRYFETRGRQSSSPCSTRCSKIGSLIFQEN